MQLILSGDVEKPSIEGWYRMLETAANHIELVRQGPLEEILCRRDRLRFTAREYNPLPIIRALLCRELLGLSGKGFYEYLSLAERAERLGFDVSNFGKYNTAPTRQTLTTAWDEVLTDTTKRTVLSLSERLVKHAYDNEQALDCRPSKHVNDAQNKSDLREREAGTFLTDQIRQTVRLARDTVFGTFDSGRADNAVYPDSRFAELQAFISLKNCGTPQGSRRMAQFRSDEAIPHGDTHLRTVGKFDHERILDGFTRSVVNLLERVNHIQILQSPVTVAIDITTWQFHADGEFPPEVSGTEQEGMWAYKSATLSLAGLRTGPGKLVPRDTGASHHIAKNYIHETEN